MGDSINGITDTPGPQRYRLDALATETLAARWDPSTVIGNPDELYWVAKLAAFTPRR